MKKMSSLSRVGLGLSLVFICLLLALIAEIYYLLWWKRRIIISREIEGVNYRKPRRYLSLCYFWCWKKQVDSSSLNTQIHHHHQLSDYDHQDFQFQPQSNNKDFILSSMEENGAELILSGPPRFLFTINEETREDLDSDDGNNKSVMEKKRNSLNDLFINNNSIVSTPTYLTPVSSPQFVTPPITPIGSCHSSQSGGGYNPFYESSNDAEFSRIVKNSPPPKFKFLRDAEEKLQRRIMLIEEAKKGANDNNNNNNRVFEKCEEDGSFIRIVVAKNKEIQSVSSSSSNHHHYHSPHFYSTGDSSSSSSSQVPSSSSSNRKFETFLNL